MAIYSLADAVNVTFAFALRGAGDTRFVSLLTFALAWPIMVIPTFAGGLAGRQRLLGWVFATAHIIGMARLLLAPVPEREVEEHAGDRTASVEGFQIADLGLTIERPESSLSRLVTSI